jgi:4-alpha-glucanotransferase
VDPFDLPPFPVEYRASGVLLHVTSLPSRYGIGDVGPGAATWIDRLHDAGSPIHAIVPLQDLLNLEAEARMNQPGRVDGNWRWRCTEDMLSSPIFQDLARLTKTTNRLGGLGHLTPSNTGC